MAEHEPIEGEASPDEAGELDELRELWARVPSPRPDAGLERPDENTLATLDWMRAAWRSLEPPPVELPLPGTDPAATRTPDWRRLAPLAAAAAVLVVIAPLALRRTAGPGEEAAVLRGRADEAPPAVLPKGETGTAEHEAGGAIALLAPDRMELRSGPVRLVLLTPEGSTQDTPDEVIR